MATQILTQNRLKELLHYDPDTGVFTWRVNRTAGVKAGDVAGSLDGEGYRVLCLDKRYYKAHRVAWLYVTGDWPPNVVDHINRNPSDNKFCNLRLATLAQNGMNRRLDSRNRTGVSGVSWDAYARRWRADIGENGKLLRLGSFVNFDDAVAARKAAEETHIAAAYIQS